MSSLRPVLDGHHGGDRRRGHRRVVFGSNQTRRARSATLLRPPVPMLAPTATLTPTLSTLAMARWRRAGSSADRSTGPVRIRGTLQPVAGRLATRAGLRRARRLVDLAGRRCLQRRRASARRAWMASAGGDVHDGRRRLQAILRRSDGRDLRVTRRRHARGTRCRHGDLTGVRRDDPRADLDRRRRRRPRELSEEDAAAVSDGSFIGNKGGGLDPTRRSALTVNGVGSSRSASTSMGSCRHGYQRHRRPSFAAIRSTAYLRTRRGTASRSRRIPSSTRSTSAIRSCRPGASRRAMPGSEAGRCSEVLSRRRRSGHRQRRQ